MPVWPSATLSSGFTYVSDTKPGDPSEGETWYDTSAQEAKVFDGAGNWPLLTVTHHDELGGTSAGQHRSDSNIQGVIDGSTLAQLAVDDRFQVVGGDGPNLLVTRSGDGNQVALAPGDGAGSYLWSKALLFDTTDEQWNLEGSPQANGNEIYHRGNDGSGSGLDADTVDGQHASELSSTTNVSLYQNSESFEDFQSVTVADLSFDGSAILGVHASWSSEASASIKADGSGVPNVSNGDWFTVAVDNSFTFEASGNLNGTNHSASVDVYSLEII